MCKQTSLPHFNLKRYDVEKVPSHQGQSCPGETDVFLGLYETDRTRRVENYKFVVSLEPDREIGSVRENVVTQAQLNVD